MAKIASLSDHKSHIINQMGSGNFFSMFKLLLYPFALIYGVLVWLRNRLYDTGFSSSVSFSIPVISVGNLSVGGTGKTPHIEYLIRLLQYRYHVATMSRGYKRKTQGFLLADTQTNASQIGDEPMQYLLKFPEVAVSVAEDRMTGIPMLLLRKPEVEVVLLDDAYQHRSVKPGINILITDFSKPFYEDYILPYGMLREGRKAAHRADIIIVSKCSQNLSKENAADVIHKMKPLDHQQIFFTGIQYGQPYDFFTQETLSIQGKNIVLVCCIAKPKPLLEYLSQQAQQVHPLTYPDHHYFTTNNLEEIKTTFENWQVSDKIIVTTEKDATRLHLHKELLEQWNLPVMVLPIEVNFLFEEGFLFDERINQYVDYMTLENLEPQH